MGNFIRDNKIFIAMMVLLIFIASKKYMNSGSEIDGTWIMPVNGVITQEFKGNDHHGLDIACGIVPIHASNDGVVTFSGWKGVYGNCVIIFHGKGIETLYGHNTNNLVRVGTKVKQGDVIAISGNSGRSFGVHSHWELRVNNICVNGLDYVNKEKPNQVVKDSQLDFNPEKYLPSTIDGI
jgi:murein DD-endopeptidase MepM/ murein hydrolase activator NlpD